MTATQLIAFVSAALAVAFWIFIVVGLLILEKKLSSDLPEDFVDSELRNIAEKRNRGEA